MVLKWLLGWLLGKGVSWAEHRAAAAKLEHETTRADRAEARVAQNQQVIDNQQVRHEIDQQIATQPEAPRQRVGDAAADTAAGKLRDDGWTRD